MQHWENTRIRHGFFDTVCVTAVLDGRVTNATSRSYDNLGKKKQDQVVGEYWETVTKIHRMRERRAWRALVT